MDLLLKPYFRFLFMYCRWRGLFYFTAIKVAQSFLSTSSFRVIKARVFDKPYSPCIQHKIKSDAYWECVLRHQAVGNGQMTSTCSMGSTGSERAIVDTSLRYKTIVVIDHWSIYRLDFMYYIYTTIMRCSYFVIKCDLDKAKS